MPEWNILGVVISIPSIEDIITSVVTPILDALAASILSLTDTLKPLFDNITSGLAGAIDTLSGSISAAVTTIGSSISGVLETLGSSLESFAHSISAGIDALGASLRAHVSGIGQAVQGALAAAVDTLESGLNRAGAALEGLILSTSTNIATGVDVMGSSLSGAITETSNAVMFAFEGMGDAISSVMGGIFTGYGSVDTEGIASSHAVADGSFLGAAASLPATHSPATVQEIEVWSSGFLTQVHAAVTTLHISNLIAEGVSLGQIDVCLTEAWRYPNTAAALANATVIAGLHISEGAIPLLKRGVLRSYQPNIPPYMDLISIYVKEGYLEDHWVEIPAEMIENFKELGFSPEWTRRLWGKHWVYPSATQLFEMLHRTAGTQPDIGVTDEVLKGMLKLHDYEPKWRGPLEAISWGTWRIYDTRTAWEMGIDDDETLEKRLIDQGYEPKDAKLLASVQKMFVLRSEIDGLTREADQDFIEGWISEDQLKADYDATPFNPFVVELRISKAKLRRTRELKRDLKAALLNRYKKRDISATELSEELSRLGVVEAWIATELEKADATILRKVYEDSTVETKGLTEAKYSRAFRVGLITEEIYRAHLTALKFGAGDISLLVELNTPTKPSPEEVKQLTVSELKAAYRVEVLSETELRSELEERRYTPEDISTIVKTEQTKIKPKAAELA